MKIVHTADWHLGNTFHRHYRDEEFRYYIKKLLHLLEEERPDAMVIAGDVFDVPNPSANAVEIFYSFLSEATQLLPNLQIVVAAGNHDSGYRIEAPQAIFRRHNIYLCGRVHRNEKGDINYDDCIIPLKDSNTGEISMVCLVVPFLRSGDYKAGLSTEEGLKQFADGLLKRYRKSAYKKLPAVAVAHYYASQVCLSEEHSERIIVGGQDAVTSEIFDDSVSYVALGHIHRKQKVGLHSYYSGSALPMSFTERNYHHGVNIVDLDDDGNAEVRQIVIPPLRQLISIPKSGAGYKEEVMRLIDELPRADSDSSSWPYLEIRIIEDEPQPGLLNELTEELSNKAVFLCRIVREKTRSERMNYSWHNVELYRQATPIELAQKIYKENYMEEMPESMRIRLEKATLKALAEMNSTDND